MFELNSQVNPPNVMDSDLQCECQHTAFSHLGAAGTGRCTRCTCTEFVFDAGIHAEDDAEDRDRDNTASLGLEPLGGGL